MQVWLLGFVAVEGGRRSNQYRDAIRPSRTNNVEPGIAHIPNRGPRRNAAWLKRVVKRDR